MLSRTTLLLVKPPLLNEKQKRIHSNLWNYEQTQWQVANKRDYTTKKPKFFPFIKYDLRIMCTTFVQHYHNGANFQTIYWITEKSSSDRG